MSEEFIIDRERAQLIVNELTKALEVKSNYQFKLLFGNDSNGKRKLVITPHSEPIEITL